MGAQGGSALGLKAWNQASGQDFSEGLRRGGSGALSREAQRPRSLPAGIAMLPNGTASPSFPWVLCPNQVLKMKNPLIEIKVAFNRLISRFNIIKERTSELEDNYAN